jgi:hypothetical protein
VAEASIYPVWSWTLKSDSLEQKSTFIEIIGLYSCSSPNFSIRLDIKNINWNVIHTFQKSNSYSPWCQANSGWLRWWYTVTGNNCVKNYVNEDSLN